MRARLAAEMWPRVKLEDGLNGKRDEKFCQVRPDGVSSAPLLSFQVRPTAGSTQRKFESKLKSG